MVRAAIALMSTAAIVMGAVFAVAHLYGRSLEAKCRAGTDAVVIDACGIIIDAAGDATDPAVTLAYYRRGFAFFQISDPSGALLDFEEADRRAARASPPLAPIIDGFAMADDSDADLAEQQLRSHYARSFIYFDRERDEEAWRSIDAAFVLQPNAQTRAILWGLRGEIQMRARQYATAIESYNAAIQSNPDNRSVFIRRGDAHHNLGRFALAVRDYDEAIRLNPVDLAIYRSRCSSGAMAGLLAAALDDCNHVLHRDDKDAVARLLRGLIELKMARLDPALSDLEAVLDLYEGAEANALYGRGVVRLRRGDLAGAASDLAAARQLDPAIDDFFVDWGIKP